MSTLFLVPLESVKSRYTYYWKDHLPSMLSKHVTPTVHLVGDVVDSTATKGAFLNFADTNSFKSAQAIELAQLFAKSKIEPGSVFLFTDAWNPVILMVRYMIDLLGVDAKIASIWHAGSYDPADFLGRCIKDKEWSFNAERSFFYASDVNFFATEFHIDMIASALGIDKSHKSIVRTGFPMEYISNQVKHKEKEDIIVFPHRLSVEKNYELFKVIEKRLPQYKFIACQEYDLSKNEYYEILSKSRIIFSANTQETLGIGVFEGFASYAYPYVPDHLSYKEMYSTRYSTDKMYDIEYHVNMITMIMSNHDSWMSDTKTVDEINNVYSNFFCGTTMYQTLKDMLYAK